MTDEKPKVQAFTISEGFKPLIKKLAPAHFDKARVTRDAKEIDALLSKLRKFNPYYHPDWLDTWDAASTLSCLMRRYGLDVSLSVSINITEARPTLHKVAQSRSSLQAV